MEAFFDRPVERGKCHVRTRRPLQNIVARSAGQTNERIRLKLGGPIATMVGLNLLGGKRRWRPLHKCERHMNVNLINSLFAQERLAESMPGGCHLTKVIEGKNVKSVAARWYVPLARVT